MIMLIDINCSRERPQIKKKQEKIPNFPPNQKLLETIENLQCYKVNYDSNKQVLLL